MAERPVIVLGAGGHAKVVVDLLRKIGRTVVAAVEPGPVEGRTVLGAPVEDEDMVSRYSVDEIDLALGLGMPAQDPIGGLTRRVELGRRFAARGYRFPAFVHPAAIIGEGTVLGGGTQIMAGAIVQAQCTIGPFSILNTRVSVDHDCVLDEGCHIAPGVTLGGSVHVGRETLVGIGAIVRQSIAIGSQALIGAGAVVVADVADGARRVGVPAREQAP
jgi:UDP-perosamine 4-acetyltransferase